MACALLLATALVLAQDQPSPTFRAGVKLVQVSVVAQDKKGKPVTDLRSADFQVLDNGAPREIRLFLAENSGATPPEPGAPGIFTNQIAVSPHNGYALILIDSLFTDFGDPDKGNGSANARLSALHALQSIPTGGKIAIYATGRKLELICEFTSDRDLLKRQLEGWKPRNDTTATSNDVLSASLGATSKDHRGDAPPEAFAATVTRDAQLRAAASDDEMNAIADHLAGVPGRKNLIWLSDRFAIGPRALRRLTSAGVAIYPVDVDGVCRDCPPWPTSLMDSIAALTGGIAFHGRNDIDVAIRQAMDDGRVSYTLGFYRSDDDKPETVHQIRIRVSRPGVALRYSASYQTEAAAPVAADPQTELVRAMNRPIDASAIPIRASLTRSHEDLNLKAVLDVTSLELGQSSGRWRGSMEIVARFTGADGKPVGEILTQTMNVHLSQIQYDSALQHGLPFLNEMKVPPKATALKVLFTDLVSGKIGTLSIPLSEVVAGAEAK